MGRSLFLAALLLLTSGCSEFVINAPDLLFPDGAQSTFLAIEREAVVELRAFDRRAERLRSSLVRDHHGEFVGLTALFLERSLDELGLQEGSQRHEEEGTALAALPHLMEEEVRRADLVDGRFSSWREAQTLSSGVAGFKIEVTDPYIRCIDQGGCLPTSTASSECIRPCPPSPVRNPELVVGVQLEPCPAGYRPVGEDPVECDPWSENGRETCADGQANFPDGGCRTIGPPCPVDLWAADLPAGPHVIFVDAAAQGSGDGSRSSPFPTIGTALTVAVSGSTIAVAKGEYREHFRPTVANITLFGACAKETILRPPDLSDLAAVRAEGLSAMVRRMRVLGPTMGLLADGGTLVAEDVLVEDVVDHHSVLATHGGRIEARGLVVRGAAAVGIVARERGHFDGSSVIVEAGTDLGVWADRESTVSISGLVISGRDASASGVKVTGGSRVDLDQAVIEHVPQFGAWAEGSSLLELEEAVIRNVAEGVHIAESQAHLNQISITEFTASGISGEAASIAATDLLLRAPPPNSARGIVGTGSAIELDRIAITAAAIGLELDTTTATVADLRIEAAREFAVRVSDSVTLSAHRIELNDNDGFGIWIDGSHVEVADLVVRGTDPNPSGAADGIRAERGSELYVNRATIEDSEAVNVRVSDTFIQLEDTILRGSPLSLFVMDEDVVAELESFRILDSQMAIDRWGPLTLTSGHIAENDIGILLREETDVTRLMRGVLFRDNGSNFSNAN